MSLLGKCATVRHARVQITLLCALRAEQAALVDRLAVAAIGAPRDLHLKAGMAPWQWVPWQRALR